MMPKIEHTLKNNNITNIRVEFFLVESRMGE